MTDSHLRELERRWQETGSLEDEAAYLKEWVRVGELSQARLKLAAYCGHEGARMALGDEAPGLHVDSNEMKELIVWAEGLANWGHEVLVRAVIAAAWQSARQESASEVTPLVVDAFDAAERWLFEPTDDAVRAAVRAWEATVHLESDYYSALEYASSTIDMGPTDVYGAMEFAVEGIVGAAQWTAVAAVRVAVRDELVPWALGYHDPVAQRVKQREELGGRSF